MSYESTRVSCQGEPAPGAGVHAPGGRDLAHSEIAGSGAQPGTSGSRQALKASRRLPASVRTLPGQGGAELVLLVCSPLGAHGAVSSPALATPRCREGERRHVAPATSPRFAPLSAGEKAGLRLRARLGTRKRLWAEPAEPLSPPSVTKGQSHPRAPRSCSGKTSRCWDSVEGLCRRSASKTSNRAGVGPAQSRPDSGPWAVPVTCKCDRNGGLR